MSCVTDSTSAANTEINKRGYNSIFSRKIFEIPEENWMSPDVWELRSVFGTVSKEILNW